MKAENSLCLAAPQRAFRLGQLSAAVFGSCLSESIKCLSESIKDIPNMGSYFIVSRLANRSAMHHSTPTGI